jgi:hypothetical protein
MSWRLLTIFVLVYLATAKGTFETVDTDGSYLTAQSLVSRGALDIPQQPHAYPAQNGRWYSPHGIGLALAYVPFVVVAHPIASLTHQNEDYVARFLISFINVPFAILLLWSFHRLLRRFGTNDTITRLLTIALGLGTIVWRYAVYDFSEEMQAALLLVAYDGTVSKTTRGAATAGLAFAALVLVKLVNLMFFPLLAFYLFAVARGSLQKRLRGALVFATPVCAAVSLLLLLNAVRFGSPFESGYGDWMRFDASHLLHSVPAFIASPDKGMLVFSPILILALFGWGQFMRSQRLEATVCLGMIVVDLLVMGSYCWWYWGQQWGPRFVAPTIWCWFLPLAFWLQADRSRIRQRIAVAATCVSLVAQIPGVFVFQGQIAYIRDTVLLDSERSHMPPDVISSWMLLAHKLSGRGEIYSVREFGVPTDRVVDLTEHTMHDGINVWLTHLAVFLDKPWLRWVTLIPLLAAAVLLTRELVQLWPKRVGQASAGCSCPPAAPGST